jgi:signal transduction histidine kinase
LSTPPPERPPLDDPPAPLALEGYAGVLASFAVGLAALVVVLATRNPRVAMFQVLPVVAAMLLGGGAAALWLLRRTRAPLWMLIAGPSLATTASMLATVMLLASVHGKMLGVVFSRPVVERGLLAAPLLGALVGGGLWLLERARQRERAVWAAQQLARAHGQHLQHERTLVQLQLLQAQIEPHFIYNTLANLRQLIKLDSARALQMLDHLIRYFKLALPGFRAERLPLRDELALVQAYLDLLSERMGRPMNLRAEVPEPVAGAMLLPGALLCLAENAVKHGLPEGDAPLELRIAAHRAGPSWLLSVRDNGAGLPSHPEPSQRGTGTGLANLRERLRLSYGEAATLHLHNAHPGCEAVLTLPWEERHARPDRR